MADPSIHSSGKGFGFEFSFWVVYAIVWRMGMGFGRKKGGWLFFPDHWVASLEEAGWVSAARVNAPDRRIQFASKQQQQQLDGWRRRRGVGKGKKKTGGEAIPGFEDSWAYLKK